MLQQEVQQAPRLVLADHCRHGFVPRIGIPSPYELHPGWGPQSSSRSETPEKSGLIRWFMVDITTY